MVYQDQNDGDVRLLREAATRVIVRGVLQLMVVKRCLEVDGAGDKREGVAARGPCSNQAHGGNEGALVVKGDTEDLPLAATMWAIVDGVQQCEGGAMVVWWRGRGLWATV